MNLRNPWIWAWFAAAGVVVGFILGRGFDDASDPSPPIAGDAPSQPAGSMSSPATPPDAANLPAARMVERTSPDGSANAAEAGAPPVAAPDDDPPFARPVDSGVVNSVDVGEVFARQMSRPSTPEHPNELADAHHAFEREPRDESWAYTMEAELQNAMLREMPAGAFRVEHVECRSTICEMRVSGRVEQGDAVRSWSSKLPSNTFNDQLLMSVSSTIATHERIDAIYILRRPATR